MVPLPEWVALGLVIAVGAAILFAAVFLLGERLYPTESATASGEGGEWKRRTEIRSYLERIDEPYHENHTLDGHPVAFYLPDHDVALTFDGSTYFRLERTDTYAILVEHEMPGAHLGTRLPFDTPTRTDRFVDENTTPYDILGVAPDASTEELTAAYRNRIKDVHPDHGGDEESFRRVREAYTAARNTQSNPDTS